MMESSDEGSDDLRFHDVGNRILHLEKASDLAMEELGWLLVDAVQIMLGARPSTRSHVVVGEDLLQLFSRFDGIWGEAHEPIHCDRCEYDRKIVRHDIGISPSNTHSGSISL